jgi:multisubunit Na+/H+ antiporter MnhB subunit
VTAFTRSIVSVPQLVAELLIVAGVVACSVAIHAFIQRRLRSEVLRRNNDVAGYLFSAVGILYAVVLGFVVVVVWQKYDATVSNVENEVNSVADLYHAVDGFTDPTRSEIRSELRRYVELVIRVEWPTMARGQQVSQAGADLIDDAFYRVNNFPSSNWRQFAAQQGAMRMAERLVDARRSRLIETVPAVPSVLWFALIAGALAMIAFCYIFGVENRPAQLVMTAILVGLIGMLFIVINAFSTPFSGSVRISPDGWLYLQQRLPHIQ